MQSIDRSAAARRPLRTYSLQSPGKGWFNRTVVAIEVYCIHPTDNFHRSSAVSLVNRAAFAAVRMLCSLTVYAAAPLQPYQQDALNQILATMDPQQRAMMQQQLQGTLALLSPHE